MKRFTLEEIANACGGQFVGTDAQKTLCITSVERDSRQIREGSLFLAIQGERVDGHDFIETCYQNGAICAICEHAPETNDHAYILVPSTLEAVKKIGKAYRQKFDIPIIGVSGSVGKTSTKEMLYAVLSQGFKTHKTQGNLNNELGVPLTLLSMPEDTEAAVIEMGISDFGEMTRLSEMVQPTVCVLTVIGNCHLECLIDRDGVLKAKTEMFAHATPNADIVLNGDDDKLITVTNVNGKKPIFYGFSDNHAYYASSIENRAEDGITCTAHFGDTALPLTIPAIGDYMVSNALAAVAVGKLLGLSNEQIQRGVAAYQTVGSRANVIRTGKITIIDDCYNANPTSVKASLDTLVRFSGRRVAILGDMKELGANETALHFETGEHAKQIGIDLVLAVGPLAKELAKGADGVWFEDVDALNAALSSYIQEGDTVLVKASRSMRLERVVERLKDTIAK